jgi:hypothetical protein
MNILSTIDVTTCNRETDVSFKTEIPMLKFEPKTYCHLICNNPETYELFKQFGEYVQETECKTHNPEEECAHKHSHILLKLNPETVAKNINNDKWLTKRMSFVVQKNLKPMERRAGKANRRQYLCKRIDCSSHFDGALHYYGCSKGQSTKGNKFTPHEHFNRRSFCLHKRKPLTTFNKPTSQCWNIMAQIEVVTGNKLHLLGRDRCPCIEKRIKQESEQRLKTLYRKEANATIDNKEFHKQNLLLRHTLYTEKAPEDRIKEEKDVRQMLLERDGRVIGLIEALKKLDKSTFFA